MTPSMMRLPTPFRRSLQRIMIMTMALAELMMILRMTMMPIRFGMRLQFSLDANLTEQLDMMSTDSNGRL